MTTEQLLGENVEAAKTRELASFGALATPVGGKVVLFGAGALGRKSLGALRRAGVEPLGFADNDSALQGTAIEGVTVLSPRDAVERWGKEALFVVTIFRPLGGEGMESHLQQLAALGCKWRASFLPLVWRYPGVLPHFGIDLPSRLVIHANKLRETAALWSDDVSREIFRQQLAWRLRADFSGASPPCPDQYFPRDIVLPRGDERFVDGGAYDGDTLRSMPEGFSRAWAIEPDPANAARLRAGVDIRVLVVEAALGRVPGRARFEAQGTMASARSHTGGIEVPVATLDELLGAESPTFLKLDVEGEELAALQGGQEMLRRAKPVVAVCIYHRPEDLWTIPLFLHEVLPSHRFALRIHEHDGFELVAYAIPPERCKYEQ